MLNVPYPIVLVIGGLVLGFVPGPAGTLTLDPDLVLVIFLPPLLYSAAFFANLRDLRRDMRGDRDERGRAGARDHGHGRRRRARLIPGMPWAVAFVLGAIVSPTDPLAAGDDPAPPAASRAGWSSLIEGESLINDGTALVAYRARSRPSAAALLALRTPRRVRR